MGPLLLVAVLVYGPVSSPGGEAPSVGRPRVVAALRARGVEVVEHAIDEAVEARRAGWRSIDELGYLTRGATALERGRRARERVELDEAARQLAEAEAAYAEGVGEPGVASLYAEAALEHGVTLGELGRADEARAAFRRALTLAPRSALTERHARPDVVRLFREVARSQDPAVAIPTPPSNRADPLIDRVMALRDQATFAGATALVEALGLDAALVVLSSTDGKRALAVRVEARCATEPVTLAPTDAAAMDATLSTLLSRPCAADTLALRPEDPRLLPPSPATAPALTLRQPAPRPRRVWPYVVGGVLGVAAAAVIGVTVGFVVADPRYAVHVDGPNFGSH